MPLRSFVRGSVAWPRLEAVGLELARRYDREAVRIEFLQADNWLSTPCVVDEELFVKIVSPQNALVHALFTAGRNLGAFSSGTEGFFTRFGSPLGMARYELEATRRMREAGVNAPEPIEAFGVNGLGVVVFEYLAEFRTLDDVDDATAARLAPELFEMLARLHDGGLAHGDLRAENVLVVDGDLYFIDATSVGQHNRAGARAYDLACAMAVLQPRIGSRGTVRAARSVATTTQLLSALEFLDFVNMRPDHNFDATGLKGEIEKVASGVDTRGTRTD